MFTRFRELLKWKKEEKYPVNQRNNFDGKLVFVQQNSSEFLLVF